MKKQIHPIVTGIVGLIAIVALAMNAGGCEMSDVPLSVRTVQAAHTYTVMLDGLTVAANQGSLDLSAAETVEKGRVAARAALNDMRRSAVEGAEADWQTAWKAFKAAVDALATEQIKADLKREPVSEVPQIRTPTPAALDIAGILVLIGGLAKLAESLKRKGQDEATPEDIDAAFADTDLADSRWKEALDRLRQSHDEGNPVG